MNDAPLSALPPLHITLDPVTFSHVQAAAEAADVTVTEWVTRTLRAAAAKVEHDARER